MDTPTPRMLKVGKVTIGLIDLDIALNKALADQLSPKDAVEYIYQAIQGKNYIPDGLAGDYKKALEREYRGLLGQEQEADRDLVIRIFGTGCISCNGLQDAVIDAMMRAGIAADIHMIHDRDEIGRHGIMATPALMINGQVKCAGIHPTPVQLEAWLLEAAGEKQ
ncbi:MAG: thioredoxin family protein [Proteobacteria bacterium]|nr:thioredoxin family protein [Pseudomonadota bacterium]MBU1419135.1 thioredoxin family protein [Pseudomonadota bacterium]MBU1455093.1 thioredoxin family protein [Pseudomonadota bacterium]